MAKRKLIGCIHGIDIFEDEALPDGVIVVKDPVTNTRICTVLLPQPPKKG